MKSTRLKISVSQDGLLPQETAEIATLEFPTLPKKLLKALGFERVDTTTYVGVLPVFINLGEKEQEIEIELGVTLPEMRKRIIDIVKTPARLIAAAAEKKKAAPKTAKKKEPIKEAAETAKATSSKKSASVQKKPTTTKTTSKTKTSTAKASTAKASTAKTSTAKAKASTTKTKATTKKTK
ncbi:MAG: hypothetical protein KAJ31_03740 [Deltaproteobacteria bacterium]|nr:hypothetical protein [Deltaproteobacteria bacterium]